MPQDRVTGATAAKWGRDTARKIAAALGASPPSGNSNECVLDGLRIVIKCAAPKTDSIGVTYLMLDRISEILGAFQIDGATFDIWSLSADVAKSAMRPTASRGASAGRVGIVSRTTFFEKGRNIRRVQI